jgi:hypothetical protein
MPDAAPPDTQPGPPVSGAAVGNQTAAGSGPAQPDSPPAAKALSRRARAATAEPLPGASEADSSAAWGDGPAGMTDDEFIEAIPPHW